MTGQSAKGMYDTFKRFADETMFAASSIDPYAQNHPDARRAHGRTRDPGEDASTGTRRIRRQLQFRHDMMRAKLYGFMDRPDAVLRRYPLTDTSLPARYARAISAYRFGEMRSAIAQIDSLIQSMPNDPYFYELKGQALLEGAHPAEAIAPLRRAVAARARARPHPDPARRRRWSPPTTPKWRKRRSRCCAPRLIKEPESADAYTTLAMAYGRKNDLADADLASAQAAFASGDNKTARELAARAKQTISDRFPRLGAGRRYRRLQQEPERQPAP